MSATPPGEEGRRTLVLAFTRAVLGFDLAGRVARALPPRPPGRARVRVLAVGKAAPEMAAGALAAWPSRIDRVLVVTPEGTPSALADGRVEIVTAGHPLPDAASVVAAERALSFARQEAGDLLVVLVSGGASALLCAPLGADLADKIAVTRALLASGAPIEDVNVVRRHLSRIKGGGLSRAAAPGRVLALLASDVLGGRPHDIGSGPTVVDPTSERDARAALSRWAPAFLGLPLQETLKPDEPAARRQRATILATPDDLAVAVAGGLASRAIACRVLSPSSAPVETLAEEYLATSAALAAGSGVVRSAEPSVPVTVAGPGRGGRASHLAALVGRRLLPGFVFLAGASDGVDGTSGAGGAVVDASFRDLGAARIDEAIAAFDTAALHEAAGTGLAGGPTGKNFADVHVLVRLR